MNFRFLRLSAPCEPAKVYDILNAPPARADLKADKSGFDEVKLTVATGGSAPVVCHAFYRDIVANELLVLDDGKFKRQTFYQVDDSEFAIHKHFATARGNFKIGAFELAKRTTTEVRDAPVAAARLRALVDHMTIVKALDFAEMKNEIQAARLTGALEGVFDDDGAVGGSEFLDVDCLKSVKGVMNTPDGVRTVKVDNTGRASFTTKRGEDLKDLDFIVSWLWRLVYRGAETE